MTTDRQTAVPTKDDVTTGQQEGDDALLLDSLEIRRFRAFKHLRIEKLGKVNLIVGKNNVGKTGLLEAIQLYASRANPRTIRQQLIARDDIESISRSDDKPMQEADVDVAIQSIRSLYHNRIERVYGADPIEIGSISGQRRVSFNISWFNRVASAEGMLLPWQLTLFDGDSNESGASSEALMLRLNVQIDNGGRTSYPLSAIVGGYKTQVSYNIRGVTCQYVTTYGLNKRDVGSLWDNALAEAEDDNVLAALRLIAPEIERLHFIGDGQRTPIVKVKGLETPVPLRNMGDGMYRLLGIAAALVSSGNGLLLVDEIDTGLHYTMQAEMWHLVFQMARKLNVQVFATTHSWDCIAAFQEAAQTSISEGVLIRLRNVEGETLATVFDENDLMTVTHRHLDVR